jgi:hypothetical protein
MVVSSKHSPRPHPSLTQHRPRFYRPRERVRSRISSGGALYLSAVVNRRRSREPRKHVGREKRRTIWIFWWKTEGHLVVAGEGVVPEPEDQAQADAAGGGGQDEPGRRQRGFARGPTEQQPPRDQVEAGDGRRRPVQRVHRHGHGRGVRE